MMNEGKRFRHLAMSIGERWLAHSVMQKLGGRSFLLGVASAVLTGCATPPGKLNDTDFVSRTLQVPNNVAGAVSVFYEGLRYCGPSSGGVIFVTHHGIADCGPQRPDGTAVCDLYMPTAYGGRSDYVLGRADFSPTLQGTTITFRVQSYAANTEKILAAWQKFAKGEAQAVCPVK